MLYLLLVSQDFSMPTSKTELRLCLYTYSERENLKAACLTPRPIITVSDTIRASDFLRYIAL